MENTCRNWCNRVHNPKRQTKIQKRNLCERIMWDQTTKKENHRTRLTVGGNLIDYTGEVSTPTSDLTTMKLNVNIFIYNIKSQYMCIDVKCFYLNNCMDRSEYIMIHISMIPQEFVEKYNLKDKVHNGYIFKQVTKGVYVLPQTWQITHGSLIQHLAHEDTTPQTRP